MASWHAAMKFILTPSRSPNDAEIASADFQGQLADDDLGGFFYDYLRNQAGRMVGVRYWGIPDSRISNGLLSNGLLRMYLDDPRFVFDGEGSFVDIVFFAQEIANLRQGSLEVETVQEFGGDGVLNLEGEWAIVFDLPVE